MIEITPVERFSEKDYSFALNKNTFLWSSKIFFNTIKIHIFKEKVSIELILRPPINKIDLLIRLFQELNYEKSNLYKLYNLLYKVSIDIGLYSPSKILFKDLEYVNEKNYPIGNFSSYFKYNILGGGWVIQGTSSPELLEKAKL